MIIDKVQRIKEAITNGLRPIIYGTFTQKEISEIEQELIKNDVHKDVYERIMKNLNSRVG